MALVAREPQPCSSELIALAYELLDAGTDTLELLYARAANRGKTTEPTPLSWALHADYLRALQRRGREILAAETATASGQAVPGRDAQHPAP